jgi:putative DNA methylase
MKERHDLDDAGRLEAGGPGGHLEGGAPRSAPGSAGFQPAKGWYSRNYLPHLDAPGLLQSVTFRLHDALPEEVVERLAGELKRGEISDTEKRRRVEAYMDAGHGACWLRRADIAELVQGALWHFDGQRYRLLAWCVMPNHVHVLIETVEGYPLHQVVHSWKSYTANLANQWLGRDGPFWYRDYFDRYVRDAEHFARVVFYIENNPVKAGLVARAEEWRFSSVNYRG